MMARALSLAVMAVLALLTVACAGEGAEDGRQVPPLPPGQEAEAQGASRLLFCRAEDAGHGPALNTAARTCFWEAYQRGEPAEFSTTQPTIEGDPVTRTFTAMAPGRVLVRMDSRDRLGPYGVFTYECAGVEPDPRTVFAVTDCTEPVPEPGPEGARPAPAAYTDGPARDCGVEFYEHGQGLDRAARECLWEAYQAGEPAILTSHERTEEGAPITVQYTVVPPDGILMRRDTTRDPLGPPGVFQYRCAGLQPHQRLVWIPGPCSDPTPEPVPAVTPGTTAPRR